MVKDLVGYRFAPTGEELVNYYLKNKNLGKTWLVGEAISEINICSYEPNFLPSLSKIESDDLVWYFFSPKEYKTAKNKVINRTTSSGFWKATGVDRKIKDKRGNRGEIGIKKTLVYHEGKTPNGVRTPWVMHEYHITCLPLDQRDYVICQVMYKGEDRDIPSGGNNRNEPSQSLVSDLNTLRAAPELQVDQQPGEDIFNGLSVDDLTIPINQQRGLSVSDAFNPNTVFSHDYNPYVQPQTYDDDDDFIINGFLNYNGGNFEDTLNGLSVDDLTIPINQQRSFSLSDAFTPNPLLFGGYNPYMQAQTYDDDVDFINNAFSNYNGENFEELIMQQNRNEHRPKKALSGIIADSSSDSGSDAESISATSYQGTSSSGRHFPSCSSTDSCKDLQTCADPSISRKARRKYQLTRRTVPLKKQMKQGTPRVVDASMDKESSLVKKEKKGLFILEDAMERNGKRPRYIYLINMIIGFILLLALITDIISVLLPIKT